MGKCIGKTIVVFHAFQTRGGGFKSPTRFPGLVLVYCIIIRFKFYVIVFDLK